MIVQVRSLGWVPYAACWEAMRAFTDARTEAQEDEIWVVEHPAVFTLGKAGKQEHLLDPGAIPVIPSDRGGQVTFHGPGQLVVYLLLNVRRLQLGPRELVRRIEQAVMECLAGFGVPGERVKGAPGVYVGGRKIAALGLRIRGSFCYHGLALNVAMDLEPFRRINPCGYAGLEVTDLRSVGVPESLEAVSGALLPLLIAGLSASQQASCDTTSIHPGNGPERVNPA